MLFLLSFVWLVAASFAFVLAILSTHWVTIPSSSTVAIQRGIFYVCDLTSSGTTQCLSIIEQTASPDSKKWIYEFAIACASMAIAGAGLSIIAIWLSGVYFHIRRRARNSSCCLLLLSLLVLIVFCCSFVVWILLISETVRLGNTIDRRMFRWPMWLAVGATGGYLISFLLMSISFCATFRRRKLIKQNYYHQNNQF